MITLRMFLLAQISLRIVTSRPFLVKNYSRNKVLKLSIEANYDSLGDLST